MDRNDIMSGLKEVMTLVKPKMDLSKVTEDANLVTDLGVDSFSMLLLSLGIENKFSIKFADNQQFQTVEQVMDYIEKQ